MEENLQTTVDTPIDAQDVDTSAETMEVANPSETVNQNAEAETEANNNANADAEAERNRIYADARRRAEKEFKEKQAKIDADIVRLFGSYTNPETGKPITSQRDYIEAYEAQQRIANENALKEKGVDPQMIAQMIDENPVVRQAKEVIHQQELERGRQLVSQDIADLGILDSRIKGLADVPKDVVELAQEKGLRLTDAYKILNFGKRTSEMAEVERQKAVNQIKGKSHLQPVNGVSVPDEAEIPADEIGTWRAFYPGLSDAELRKKWKQVH